MPPARRSARAWPLRHRNPIENYAAGRIALAGDAAHPMVPFLAQGAGQAMEDAGSLWRHLSSTRDIPAALAAYSRERAPRAGNACSSAGRCRTWSKVTRI